MSAVTRPAVLDSHLHVWDLTGGGYGWLGPDLGVLHASFTPEAAQLELLAAGVDGAVLVQADDTEADTRAMLRAASHHAWVLGVVGWVDLARPDVAREQLDRWRRHPAFCGVRHLVHGDPRRDLLDAPAVRASLQLLAEADLAVDVPDAWPHHLRQVRDVADAVPGLRVVLDHLGKPPADRADLPAWRAAVAQVAARPTTVAKVSGLQHLHRGRAGDAVVREVWETALALFGPARLMLGSDWPMTTPWGGYAPSWRIVRDLVSELQPDEQARLLSGTAVEVYRLGSRVTDA